VAVSAAGGEASLLTLPRRLSGGVMTRTGR
jgi:hypothetical protein